MNLATVRDVAIVVLALESVIVGIVLALLLWQVRSLTKLVEEQIKPMLDSMRETVGTVKGTTSLVSETIVDPALKIGGFLAGARRAWQVLLSFKSPSGEDAGAALHRTQDGAPAPQRARDGVPAPPRARDGVPASVADDADRSGPLRQDEQATKL